VLTPRNNLLVCWPRANLAVRDRRRSLHARGALRAHRSPIEVREIGRPRSKERKEPNTQYWAPDHSPKRLVKVSLNNSFYLITMSSSSTYIDDEPNHYLSTLLSQSCTEGGPTNCVTSVEEARGPLLEVRRKLGEGDPLNAREEGQEQQDEERL
jgi:hypothetical protein